MKLPSYEDRKSFSMLDGNKTSSPQAGFRMKRSSWACHRKALGRLGHQAQLPPRVREASALWIRFLLLLVRQLFIRPRPPCACATMEAVTLPPSSPGPDSGIRHSMLYFYDVSPSVIPTQGRWPSVCLSVRATHPSPPSPPQGAHRDPNITRDQSHAHMVNFIHEKHVQMLKKRKVQSAQRIAPGDGGGARLLGDHSAAAARAAPSGRQDAARPQQEPEDPPADPATALPLALGAGLGVCGVSILGLTGCGGGGFWLCKVHVAPGTGAGGRRFGGWLRGGAGNRAPLLLWLAW